MTLEATFVLPLAAALTIGILHAGIAQHEQALVEFRTEYRSVLRSFGHQGIYSEEIQDADGSVPWSRSVAVDPVRILETIGWVRDTGRTMKEYIPLLETGGREEVKENGHE